MHPTTSTLDRMSTIANLTRSQMAEQMALVLEESRAEQAHAEGHLAELRDTCPDQVTALRTAQVTVEILKQERDFLERLQGGGLLEEREVGPALEKLERRLQKLMIANWKNTIY